MAYPTNIRNVVAFGQSIDTQSWSRPDKNGKDWFTDAWDTHIADRWTNQQGAWAEHHVGIFFPFEWEQAYSDPTVTPTAAQARNHAWDGYIWNSGNTVDDPIAQAKLHPRVIAGDAVLIPKIGFSATATPFPIPAFIRSNSDWYWDGGSAGGVQPPERQFLKFQVPEVQEHVQNFLYAVHQKWGSDPAIMMFIFGEYFNGPKKDHPDDLSTSGHKEGVKTILTNAIADMPLDGDGKRQMIGLSSPTFGGTFVRDDIIDMGICPVASNVDLTFPPEDYNLLENDLYYASQGIPIMSKNDSKHFDAKFIFDWTDAPPNPFGLGSGDTQIPVTVEHAIWYRTHVVPTHTLLFNTGDEVSVSDINTAISKYARGGSEVATWGAGPIAFSSATSPGDSGVTITPIQTKEQTEGGVTSAALTLDSSQTAGSIVLYLLSLNGPRDSVTWPAGFTEIHSTTSSDSGSVMTHAWAWSDSVSGAQSVSWDTSTGYNATLVELPGDNLVVSSIGNKAETLTEIASANATSVSSGSATNVSSDSVVLAFFGFDDYSDVETGKAYGNGFTELVFQNTSGVAASHGLAARVVDSVDTYSSTFSTTDAGSRLYGSIAIIEGSEATPVLTTGKVTITGATTADSVVTTDRASGVLSVVITEAATAPTPAQVAAGQDDAGTAVGVGKFQTKNVMSSGPVSMSVTGLSASTAYYAHSSHDGSSVFTVGPFTTSASPTLSGFTANTGSVAGSIDITVNTTTTTQGTMYYVVDSQGYPSTDQVAAGQNSLGSAAKWSYSAEVVDPNPQTATVTGLSPGESAILHCFQRVSVSVEVDDVPTVPTTPGTPRVFGPVVSAGDPVADLPSVPSVASLTKIGEATTPAELVALLPSLTGGSYIRIPDGTYTGDWAVTIPSTASGSSGNPSYILADTVHGAVCPGMRMDVQASHIVIGGIKSNVSSESAQFVPVASNVRLTGCHFDCGSASGMFSAIYIANHSSNTYNDIEVDNCTYINVASKWYFASQNGLGSSVVNQHGLVANNYVEGTTSGAEKYVYQLGLGWSPEDEADYEDDSKDRMEFIIEDNHFNVSVTGGYTTVDVKSSGNIQRNNYFEKGAPTVRHGRNNAIYGNWCETDEFYGGHRVIGLSNTFAFNYLEKSANLSMAAIELWRGMDWTGSSQPISYYPNKDGIISHNVFNDFGRRVNIEAQLTPTSTFPILSSPYDVPNGNTIANNVIHSSSYLGDFQDEDSTITESAFNAANTLSGNTQDSSVLTKGVTPGTLDHVTGIAGSITFPATAHPDIAGTTYSGPNWYNI